MRWRIVLGGLFAALLVGGTGWAQTQDATEATEPKKDDAAEADDSFGHGGQVGLRLGITGGYRMVFRYDESPYCAEPDLNKLAKDQQKFCGHAAPFALDVAASFGIVDSLEPYLWGRFGLAKEEETDTDPILIFGAGVRLYTMSDSAFKIFIEPAAGVEVEGGAGNPLYEANDPEYKTDLVFHLAAGPQLDLAKEVGLYAHAGITTGIFRAIHSTLEAQFGVQGRL
jgi:hypothetical protein